MNSDLRPPVRGLPLVEPLAVCARESTGQEQPRETLCIVRTGDCRIGHCMRSVRAVGRRARGAACRGAFGQRAIIVPREEPLASPEDEPFLSPEPVIAATPLQTPTVPSEPAIPQAAMPQPATLPPTTPLPPTPPPASQPAARSTLSRRELVIIAAALAVGAVLTFAMLASRGGASTTLVAANRAAAKAAPAPAPARPAAPAATQKWSAARRAYWTANQHHSDAFELPAENTVAI